MTPPHPLARIDHQIILLNVVANFVGAAVTFFYFGVIDPMPQGDTAVRTLDTFSLLLFLGIMLALFVLGSLLSQRFSRPIDVWRKRVEAGAPVADIPPNVKRLQLNYPLISAAFTFIMWVIAGVFFSLLAFDLSLRSFIGIVGVGGVLTAALYYFTCDLLWRRALLIYFPDGNLSPYHGVRVSVQRRLLVVFFLVGLYPLTLLAYFALSRAPAILTAANPQIVMDNLVILVLFVLGLSLVVGGGLVILMGRGLTKPLLELQTAMGRVGQGDFTARVEVTTTDELGYLGEGFNLMTNGLRQGELLRNLLNIYVSPEVAREAIEHGAQLGGKMVECSILFSDIRNFTGLSENLPPQELIALLNRYMSAMVEVVIAHGGIVNKFGGDSLLAIFGSPINPIGDHAARAIQTAVDMRTALGRFNAAQRQGGSIELNIGLGIATGPAVAGNVGGHGRLEYTVIGDTVNLASRLQSLTKEVGHHTLVNAAAYEAARSNLNLTVEEIPGVIIRGKNEPVKVYAVL